MRSRLVLLSVAVTSMVVVAFSIPLAVLVRDLAADRAITAAEREANALARTLAVVGDVSDATIEALIRGADDTVQLAVIRQTGDVIGDASGMSQEGVGSLSGRSLLREEDGGVASYVPVVGLDPRDISPELGRTQRASAQCCGSMVRAGGPGCVAGRIGGDSGRPAGAFPRTAGRGTGGCDRTAGCRRSACCRDTGRTVRAGIRWPRTQSSGGQDAGVDCGRARVDCGSLHRRGPTPHARWCSS